MGGRWCGGEARRQPLLKPVLDTQGGRKTLQQKLRPCNILFFSQTSQHSLSSEKTLQHKYRTSGKEKDPATKDLFYHNSLRVPAAPGNITLAHIDHRTELPHLLACAGHKELDDDDFGAKEGKKYSKIQQKK